MVPCGSSPVTRFALASAMVVQKTKRLRRRLEFRVKRWHRKYEILNYIESHILGLNYVLIKSNRTALQTYKVEERTFGTPCSRIITQPEEHSLWFSKPNACLVSALLICSGNGSICSLLNRPFAWWRHFTTTIRILRVFAFLCKLGLSHWNFIQCLGRYH